MAGVRVVILARELRAFVRQMPIVRDGVRAVGEDIAEVARQHAPVLTGKLRESIRVTRPIRKGAEGDTVRVEATVYYAQFVELGTRFMPPQPFLRPAAARYRQDRGTHYAQVVRKRARRG